jgi:hypothetical protein
MSPSPSARGTLQELKKVTRRFNELGLADRAYDPVLRTEKGMTFVNAPNRLDSRVLENVSYGELYDLLERESLYLVKMIDGALLQFDYCFDSTGRKLERHRLAFLPSPHLDPFLELEEDYWEGRSFLDIVGHQVSPVPLRVDYDNRIGVASSVQHPAAHLTLGQYLHCRIPVSGPMNPAAFASFVGTHFYSDETGGMGRFDSTGSNPFSDSLTDEERRGTFFQVAAG